MADQEQFLDVIDRDEAERRFYRDVNTRPLGVETIPLANALGRILANDVVSRVDVPSFDRSNFDGFALQAADTFGADEERPCSARLLSGSIAPGRVPVTEIEAGVAVRIATGGMLPRGADAVLMIEDADEFGEQVQIRRAVSPGFGVAFAGSDVAQGELILRRGERLSSRETGVLAAIGEVEVDVRTRPLVGVISTGNEIIAPGQPMRPGLVYDSNAVIISDAVREAGGEPRVLGIVGDDETRLKQSVIQALDGCDVVVLSGGTSKGEGDLCYRVVRDHCQPGIAAHGVALKPGKPVCLASHHGKAVVILPGFPTSAIFTFHEFVAPLIRKLGGADGEQAHTVQASMAVKVNSVIGRTEYLLVGLVPRADGEGLVAYPMGKGSGSVTTFSRADGFATIARHDELLSTDQEVTITRLGRDLKVADLIVVGSHCVGLDRLLSKLNEQGFHSKLIVVGSSAGLQAAQRGECDIAGIHLLDPKTGTYNHPYLTPELQLVNGYTRRQGIIFRRGDSRFEDFTAKEAIRRALDDPECMMVNRNQGSGTRILIDQLLYGKRPRGYAIQSSNHHAVAAAITQERADWGVGIWQVAQDERLGFLPFADECFDFVVPKQRAHRPAVVAFQTLLRDPSLQAELSQLGCTTANS